MSPAFEAFLARLYVDANYRRRFLCDPAAVAASAGLTSAEIDAAVAMDRVGLELAATSFARKRLHHHRSSAPHRVRSMIAGAAAILASWIRPRSLPNPKAR